MSVGPQTVINGGDPGVAGMSALPIEIVLKIVALLFDDGQNPVPQLYLRLAMVNKEFYSVFMSDLLWQRLDVHRIGHNISAHYLNHKAAMGRRELEFCGAFDWRCWRHPAVDPQELSSFSIYTQSLLMAEHDKVDTMFRVDLKGQISNRQTIEFAAGTPNGLWFASDELLNDTEFMHQLAGGRGFVTQYLPKDQRQDRNLVLHALRHADYNALEVCCDQLKDDKELVLEFIYKWGFGLEFASKDLQNDRDVALAAVSVNGSQLRWCSELMRSDREVVLRAVSSNGNMLQHASRDLINDVAVALQALHSTVRAFEFVGRPIQADIIRRGYSALAK